MQSIAPPPATLSKARVDVTRYTIRPTGWDQLNTPDGSDELRFCAFVEQYPDTGRWRIYDGFRHGYIATRKGKWTRDRPQVRHLTRFDTAEEAIEVALRCVDERNGEFGVRFFLRRQGVNA